MAPSSVNRGIPQGLHSDARALQRPESGDGYPAACDRPEGVDGDAHYSLA